jgi:hypothetical protein
LQEFSDIRADCFDQSNAALKGGAMPIEDFFRPEEVPSNHPLLRLVSRQLKSGHDAVFELYRPRETLGFRKARIVIHFFRDGQEVDYRDDDCRALVVRPCY